MRPLAKYSLLLLSIIALGITIVTFLSADPVLSKRIEGISTIIFAFLTASYVILTYQILRSTRPQPHVFISLPTDDEDFRVFLSIKNIGNRPAYKVVATIEPSLDILAPTDAFKGAAAPMLNQPFMPPGSEVRNMISNSLHVHSLPTDKICFSIRLRYTDSQGRKYSDSYHINLGSYIFDKKMHAAKKSDN